MKKSADEILDQTLTGLRHTQPRDGMEQRILHALQNQPTPKSARPTWTWSLATTAFAAMLLAALLVTLHHHFTSANIASTAPSAPSTELSSRPEPQRSEGAVERPASPARATTNAHIATDTTPTQQPHPTSPEQPTPGDALAEMRAPSQPAPELPLTDQEKLMLRILHRGDPIQLAQLDPAHRAAERAADRQQFHDFFTKPTTGDNQ